MSIEMIFYSPSVDDSKTLRDFLLSRGFERRNYFMMAPDSFSEHFHWFSNRNFESFDGVEATIFWVAEEFQDEFPDCFWALHTRTRASASAADKAYQNEIIREARRTFGGDFHNDWFGKNRYTKIEPDTRDAVARGIYLAYETVKERVIAVKYSLPMPSQELEGLMGTNLEPLSKADPTRVLYNALVPFAIAALEHFFSQAFKILLKYNEKAQAKLNEASWKVEIPDVIAIKDGVKTVEDIVAERYSFQSIGRIHQAFSDWSDLDFYKIIRKRKKIGRRLPFLERHLQNSIDFRHGIVHRFDVNPDMRKGDIELIFDVVMLVIDEFVNHLEKSRKIPIRDDAFA